MLPGRSYRPDNYFQLIDELADEFRVITPAFPPISPMAALLDGIVSILDQLHLDRVDVFGCSFGGYVAQALVSRCPERVDNLVLAQTAARHFASARTLEMMSRVFARAPLFAVCGFMWTLWMRWFDAPGPQRDFWKHRLRFELNAMTKEQHLAGMRNIADFMTSFHPSPGWLRQWGGGVLILESRNDRAYPS